MTNIYKLIDPPSEIGMIMKQQHEAAVRDVEKERAQGAQSMEKLADVIFAEVEGYVDRRLEAARERFLQHHHKDDPRVDKLIDICTSLERRLAIAEDRYQRIDDMVLRLADELMSRRSR